ncbi:unnamed protein product, partial [Closterium sp. NIES-53]
QGSPQEGRQCGSEEGEGANGHGTQEQRETSRLSCNGDGGAEEETKRRGARHSEEDACRHDTIQRGEAQCHAARCSQGGDVGHACKHVQAARESVLADVPVGGNGAWHGMAWQG